MIINLQRKFNICLQQIACMVGYENSVLFTQQESFVEKVF